MLLLWHLAILSESPSAYFCEACCSWGQSKCIVYILQPYKNKQCFLILLAYITCAELNPKRSTPNLPYYTAVRGPSEIADLTDPTLYETKHLYENQQNKIIRFKLWSNRFKCYLLIVIFYFIKTRFKVHSTWSEMWVFDCLPVDISCSSWARGSWWRWFLRSSSRLSDAASFVRFPG